MSHRSHNGRSQQQRPQRIEDRSVSAEMLVRSHALSRCGTTALPVWLDVFGAFVNLSTQANLGHQPQPGADGCDSWPCIRPRDHLDTDFTRSMHHRSSHQDAHPLEFAYAALIAILRMQDSTIVAYLNHDLKRRRHMSNLTPSLTRVVLIREVRLLSTSHNSALWSPIKKPT